MHRSFLKNGLVYSSCISNKMRCGAINDNLIVYLRDVPLRVAPMALEACASFAQVPGPCTFLSGSSLTMLPSQHLFVLFRFRFLAWCSRQACRFLPHTLVGWKAAPLFIVVQQECGVQWTWTQQLTLVVILKRHSLKRLAEMLRYC